MEVAFSASQILEGAMVKEMLEGNERYVEIKTSKESERTEYYTDGKIEWKYKGGLVNNERN